MGVVRSCGCVDARALPPDPHPTLPHKGGGNSFLLARQRADDVDHLGDVEGAETHIHEALV